MATLLLTHADMAQYTPGIGHPEAPARLTSVLEALGSVAGLIREEAPLANKEQLCLAHDTDFIETLHATAQRKETLWIDADTRLSPDSWQAALRASGAAIRAVEAVMDGSIHNAFCATRPPGHHAGKASAMGFCLVNPAAIGARFALETYGLERVAIVDFDVHHGNGTQDIALDDPRLLYISSHQMPLFPGTGLPEESGPYNNLLNLPLEMGEDGDTFRHLWKHKALPRLTAFQPQMIMISAGFDAHHRDPLGGLDLEEEDFSCVTRYLVQEANVLCERRIVSVLEGGYHPDSLGACVRAHVEALCQQ
jgi:acetoin utilization deacetylase AcuC-like enzyme